MTSYCELCEINKSTFTFSAHLKNQVVSLDVCHICRMNFREFMKSEIERSKNNAKL